MRVALDTNVLAYAEGVGDEARCAAAIELVESLSDAFERGSAERFHLERRHGG